jgi:nicotinamidase-related amidase
MITLDPRTSALVLIDLQQGVLAMSTVPRAASDVLRAGQALAERFRAAGAPVVLVNVTFAPDYADTPPRHVDRPLALPPGGLPPAWATFPEGLAAPGDLRITKRQWGAFTGTELDLQFRRRGVRTVVVGGIATNFGVESTVRHAWELGYDVIVAEDACATTAPVEAHEIAFAHVFPRIARVSASHGLAFG